MRAPIALVVLTALGGAAWAACPPDCVLGGGPVAADCFVAWSGISSMDVTCIDGTGCDLDGKVDGVCTLAVQACINVAGVSPSCVPSGLTRPPVVKPAKNAVAQALAGALASLDPSKPGCTAPGLGVPVKMSLAGIKPGLVRLRVTSSSAGKRDIDKLRLTCQPGSAAPSFARDVQPIFTARCAIPACHQGPAQIASGGQSLEEGVAYVQAVNVRATTGKLLRVKPGSIKGSQLAHRILGKGLPPRTTAMPQGCPGFVPAGGCLTQAEIFTILSWIANGAPNN